MIMTRAKSTESTLDRYLLDKLRGNEVTQYFDNIVYQSDGTVLVSNPVGYALIDKTNNMTMHYYLKDHEGNVRVVTDGDGTVEQVNHYYPFGGLMGMSTGSSVQPYKYNGKELDRSNGLDLYDYGARWYDAALGRWLTVDPHAESYQATSPFAYCKNDPVNRIDPDGKDDIFDEDGNFLRRTDTGMAVMIMSDNQLKNIAEVDFTKNKNAIQNIGSYYLSIFDKQVFNLSVSNTGGDVPLDVAFSNDAGTLDYDIYLTNGHVNSTLGNCYDFECVTYHESTHRYDKSTQGGSIGEVNAIIRTAIECPSWNNASDNYIQSQASYAAGRLNDYGYSDNLIPRNTVQRLNKAFEGYATFELNNNNVSVFNLLKECVVLGNRKK